MKTVLGYTYDENAFIAVNGEYTFAEKDDGEKYFLKRFSAPKYPKKNLPSYKEKLRECREWMDYRSKVIKALKKVSNGKGNIVTPIELFLDKPYYIMVSHKVDTATEDISVITKLAEGKRILFLRTIAGCLQRIHSVDIVHGDLKPENIIISKTSAGNYVSKIIDFDDSYFTGQPPVPDQVVGTETYWSPELAIYKLTEDMKYQSRITTASDIFALGIIFHEFCTGRRPEENGELVYQTVMANACGTGTPLKVDPDIKPIWIRELIRDMLQMDPEKRPTADEVLNRLNLPPAETLDSTNGSHVGSGITTESSPAAEEPISMIEPVKRKASESKLSKSVAAKIPEPKTTKPAKHDIAKKSIKSSERFLDEGTTEKSKRPDDSKAEDKLKHIGSIKSEKKVRHSIEPVEVTRPSILRQFERHAISKIETIEGKKKVKVTFDDGTTQYMDRSLAEYKNFI